MGKLTLVKEKKETITLRDVALELENIMEEKKFEESDEVNNRIKKLQMVK